MILSHSRFLNKTRNRNKAYKHLIILTGKIKCILEHTTPRHIPEPISQNYSVCRNHDTIFSNRWVCSLLEAAFACNLFKLNARQSR